MVKRSVAGGGQKHKDAALNTRKPAEKPMKTPGTTQRTNLNQAAGWVLH
tara:strand:+ start:406 stop:552 length:147 start_codon:yes stop_codon:yes gene_type:complete